jgi:hypothetical protein
VGRFQYHFSRIERALNLCIAKLFDLSEISADIVCANIDFVKKVYIVRSQVIVQFKDKDNAVVDLLGKIYGINEPDRQIVIHSTFEPDDVDGVRFTRLIAKKGLDRPKQVWSKKKFEDLFTKMDTLAGELERLVNEIEPYGLSMDLSDSRNLILF